MIKIFFRKIMTIFSIGILSTLLISFAHAEQLNGIAAFVNDGFITQYQLQENVDMTKKQLVAQQTPLPKNSVIRKKVLQHLIDQELQLQQAKKAGIKLDDATLKKTIKKIAQRNHMTPAQLRHMVAAEGLDYKTYKQMLKKEIIISKLQQSEVAPTITITKAEVKTLLKQSGRKKITEYQVENILIPVSENPSPQEITQAHVKANKLIKKLKKGANFRQAAVENSAANDALRGGELGWRTAEQLPEVFAKRVVHMKWGNIAGPIRTANGFHIIKVVAKRYKKNPGRLSMKQAQQVIYERKYSEALESWIKKLRAAAYIKINKS